MACALWRQLVIGGIAAQAPLPCRVRRQMAAGIAVSSITNGVGSCARRPRERGLSEEVLQQLTRIDGAVLVGPEATCYAIGVILDGLATDRGDRARGARFNSAVRYVDCRDEPVVIVVKSEDGMIEVITRA
jgi:DNA integrity scanning protein DisA with diadenylate cyclase activity